MSAIGRRSFLDSVLRTAGFNIAAMISAGLGGVIIARSLGPAVTGEYAAITAWFGISVMLGELGQPAALCYHISSEPDRASGFLATSRSMMAMTGLMALGGGVLLAPLLANGQPGLTASYRIAFVATLAAFIGASYTTALQATDISRWNNVRLSQPILSFVATLILWRLGILTLDIALLILGATLLVRLLYAYIYCRTSKLAPGSTEISLVLPLARYGVAQIAALTPAVLNMQLDQLILSQTVSPAELGHYAVAVSITLIPLPAVTAIGNVAFPRLASRQDGAVGALRLQRASLVGSFVLASGILAPICVSCSYLIPLIYGPSYKSSVILVWVLAPGALFLSCGQVVGDLLRGRNQPETVAWAQGFAAVFTVVLLFALLPRFGVLAAAVASTIAYGIALLAMLRRLRKFPRHSRLVVASNE